jgi:hypothetical protein
MEDTIYTFNVLIGSECNEFHDEINYAFSEVAIRLGCCFDLYTNENGNIDLFYGASPYGDFPFLKYDQRYYQRNIYEFKCFKNGFLWSPKNTKNISEIDFIGGVFRLLAMIDENHILESQRDKRGVFLVDDLPVSRSSVFDKPLVEYNVAQIESLLKSITTSFNAQQNKFDGYRNVLLLTHDTDAVNLSSPLEILFNFVKSIYRFDKVRFKMFSDGVKGLGQDLKNNPLYGFQGWEEFTRNRDIKSAFYLYARTTVKPTINDCKSSIQDKNFDWADLRAMINDGHEFGLHPSINAKFSLNEFISSKKYVEDKIQAPVYGLRHHYWALDWEKPYKTHRLHENAGFRYDLSTAWRDRAGFRAGTCMPFKPWDPVRKRALNIYSIPLTVMDGHLMLSEFKELDAKEKLGQSVIDEVFTNNGVIVLDWHTETICNTLCFQNYISVLDNIMVKLMSNDDLLVTTPFELTKIWHERSHLFFSRLVS